MHDAERATLLRGTVVGKHHDNRVLELAHVTQTVDEAANLVVGVVEECGKRFLQTAVEALLVLGQVVPRIDARVARRKLGFRRDHTEFELPSKPALADDIPTFVVLPAVLVHIGLRCLMRRVRGAEWHIREERAVGSYALAVADHLHQLVDHVFTDVVPVG